MATPNDIERTMEASDEDAVSLRRQAVDEAGGGTRMKAPVQEVQHTLNQELMNMLTLGKRSAQFQGIERCIRVVESGTPNQRHCMSMMVNNMTLNQKMCATCDRIRDPNASPRTINSSMIRLSDKELAECGLEKDPLYGKAQVVQVKDKKRRGSIVVEPVQRRPKVAKPNAVNIEVSMKELEESPNIVYVLLKKTLDSVYELPISKFSEAEAIRETSEKIKALLSQQG